MAVTVVEREPGRPLFEVLKIRDRSPEDGGVDQVMASRKPQLPLVENRLHLDPHVFTYELPVPTRVEADFGDASPAVQHAHVGDINPLEAKTLKDQNTILIVAHEAHVVRRDTTLLHAHGDIDRVSADETAIDGRQVVIDAVVPDANCPDAHGQVAPSLASKPRPMNVRLSRSAKPRNTAE